MQQAAHCNDTKGTVSHLQAKLGLACATASAALPAPGLPAAAGVPSWPGLPGTSGQRKGALAPSTPAGADESATSAIWIRTLPMCVPARAKTGTQYIGLCMLAVSTLPGSAAYRIDPSGLCNAKGCCTNVL